MVVYRPCSNCSMPVVTGTDAVIIRHDCPGCGGYAVQSNDPVETLKEKAA